MPPTHWLDYLAAGKTFLCRSTPPLAMKRSSGRKASNKITA